MIKYKRVLLKISGEVLGGKESAGFNELSLKNVATLLKEASATGVQIAVVCGAGNIMRGAVSTYLSRAKADQAGMLGTAVNALVLGNMLESLGVPSVVCGAFEVEGVIPKLTYDQIEESFEKGRVVLFACGMGVPYFTTDTAGVLKALEIRADLMIKATKVDGVYSSDPQKNTGAILFRKISYEDVLAKKLGVMDLTAVSLAMENKLSLRVTDMFKKGNVTAIIAGEDIGTLIC